MASNFFEAIHQIASEKQIPRESIEDIVIKAIMHAYKKQYGAVDNMRVVFDRDKSVVKIVARKMVVREPRNLAEEVAYRDAVKFKSDANVGDEIEVEEEPFASFGRIAAQTAKQVFIQQIKECEKNIVYEDFKEKEGELINGYMQRRSRDTIFVDIGYGRTEGVLPKREQSPLEHYKTGDRIKALVWKVEKNAKGPNIVLTRVQPEFIKRLFEMEIPEVYEGIVIIQNIVREQGMRTKVAVSSSRDDVDSVGACVGMKGVRIQSIVRELEGEKVDVVEYSDDRKTMVNNALTPAHVKEVIDARDGMAIAVVESDQYNLAVGKNGHNVRLASRLCGFEIQVKTEEQYREFLSSSESRMLVEQLFKEDTDETSLAELPLEPRVIELLEKGGIFSVEELVETSLENLMKIDGIGEKTANRIMEIVAETVDFEEDGEGEKSDEEEGEDSEGEEKPEEPKDEK
jgi:transcription termination/antitermination protein NusA